jgi:hypothetical protein
VKKAIEELLRKTTDGGDSLFVSEIKGAIRGAIEDSFGKNTDRSLSMVVKEIEDAIARAIERGLKRPNGSKPAPGEPASKDLVAIVREALTAWETAGCSGDAVPCFQRGSPPPTCNPTFASFYFALNVWNAIERMKLYRSGGEECYLASAGANSRRCSDDGNDTPEDIIKLKLYDEISKPPTENSNIHIIGFADNRGFVDKNIILAERRSEYIEGLMNRAFSSTRNKMISYGKGQEYQLQVRPNRVVGESSDSRRVDVKWCDYNP